MGKTWRRWMGVLAVLAAFLPQTGAAADGKPKIVATFTIIGDLVEQVGGDAVTVTTLVGPDGDAHVFEPKPSDLAAVAQADLIVSNGLGMEPWLERLIQAANYQGKVLVASEGVTPLPFKEDANGSGQMPDNPHAFQDLANGRRYLKNIADGLAKVVAPQDVVPVTLREYTLDTAMAQLDREVKQKLGALPDANRRILTSHDAFHYFA